jgi:hypothetical protein
MLLLGCGIVVVAAMTLEAQSWISPSPAMLRPN